MMEAGKHMRNLALDGYSIFSWKYPVGLGQVDLFGKFHLGAIVQVHLCQGFLGSLLVSFPKGVPPDML